MSQNNIARDLESEARRAPSVRNIIKYSPILALIFIVAFLAYAAEDGNDVAGGG